jgi:hypothetical protein
MHSAQKVLPDPTTGVIIDASEQKHKQPNPTQANVSD